MKKVVFGALLLLTGLHSLAQLQTPDVYLGYPLGSRFTSHHQVNAYFRYVASASKNVRVISYGKSYEGRELLVAVISSAENMNQLEQIRRANVAIRAGAGNSDIDAQPAILWMSYSVHGNEASSSEASMRTLYALAEGSFGSTRQWLKNTVVLIDPCLNPDGRERYVNYYNTVASAVPDADPDAREHREPWPGGRLNHYYFDLNRDWAWQSQVETRQRMVLYHEWMPQVHIDFHEQAYTEPYYFAPAAEPVHQDITAFQRQFQVVAGKNNARYFDHNGWQYFTKERFDLLYPSYGDTYPLYNGAIGMTYEQGGINAGLAVEVPGGDTLTLRDRIDHHFTTGMATLETVSANARLLVSEFKKYFDPSHHPFPGSYRSYVIKADNLSRMKRLVSLLDRNHIEYAFGGGRTLDGYCYETKKQATFSIQRNDLIVNLKQPAAVLANVLLEPETRVTDSNTYDITAWSLPYAYGLSAFAIKEVVEGAYPGLEEKKANAEFMEAPYAWILPWNGLEDAQILIALQRMGIRVRMAEKDFTIDQESYPQGSLLIYRMENEKINKDISTKVATIITQFHKPFRGIKSGFVYKGKDFGSSVYPLLTVPKVAMVAGDDVSSQSAGEIWHLFEQELKYPLHIIDEESLGGLELAKTNVLVLPDGTYMRKHIEKLDDWIKRGGKIILIEDAISSVSNIRPFEIRRREFPEVAVKERTARVYGDKNNNIMEDAIPGAVYKVDLDETHPLSLGLGGHFYMIKTDDKVYEPLDKGWNVGTLKPNALMAGVVGKNVQRKLVGGMVIGVQPVEKGNIIYLSSDILFRSFWECGKQLFVNALFLVK